MSDKIEEKILAFLRKHPETDTNFSEIGRAINKAPPTIKRAVEKLKKEGKVMVIDKKSMKLVRLIK